MEEVRSSNDKQKKAVALTLHDTQSLKVAHQNNNFLKTGAWVYGDSEANKNLAIRLIPEDLKELDAALRSAAENKKSLQLLAMEDEAYRAIDRAIKAEQAKQEGENSTDLSLLAKYSDHAKKIIPIADANSVSHSLNFDDIIQNVQKNLAAQLQKINEAKSSAKRNRLLSLRALDHYLSLEDKKKARKNLVDLISIKPQYQSAVDEHHVALMLELAGDNPKDFISAINYLASAENTRKALVKFLNQTKKAQQQQSAKGKEKEDDNAAQAVDFRFMQYAPQVLIDYPEVTEAIYKHFPEEFAKDLHSQEKNFDLAKLLNSNREWLTDAHILALTARMPEDVYPAQMYLKNGDKNKAGQRPLVRLQQAINSLINNAKSNSENKKADILAPETISHLEKILDNKDLRGMLNLGATKGSAIRLLEKTRDKHGKLNQKICAAVALDEKLSAALRSDKKNLESYKQQSPIIFAADFVLTSIANRDLWFEYRRKNEFIAQLVEYLKSNQSKIDFSSLTQEQKAAICWYVKNTKDLYDRFLGHAKSHNKGAIKEFNKLVGLYAATNEINIKSEYTPVAPRRERAVSSVRKNNPGKVLPKPQQPQENKKRDYKNYSIAALIAEIANDDALPKPQQEEIKEILSEKIKDKKDFVALGNAANNSSEKKTQEFAVTFVCDNAHLTEQLLNLIAPDNFKNLGSLVNEICRYKKENNQFLSAAQIYNILKSIPEDMSEADKEIILGDLLLLTPKIDEDKLNVGMMLKNDNYQEKLVENHGHYFAELLADKNISENPENVKKFYSQYKLKIQAALRALPAEKIKNHAVFLAMAEDAELEMADCLKLILLSNENIYNNLLNNIFKQSQKVVALLQKLNELERKGKEKIEDSSDEEENLGAARSVIKDYQAFLEKLLGTENIAEILSIKDFESLLNIDKKLNNALQAKMINIFKNSPELLKKFIDEINSEQLKSHADFLSKLLDSQNDKDYSLLKSLADQSVTGSGVGDALNVSRYLKLICMSNQEINNRLILFLNKEDSHSMFVALLNDTGFGENEIKIFSSIIAVKLNDTEFIESSFSGEALMKLLNTESQEVNNKLHQAFEKKPLLALKLLALDASKFKDENLKNHKPIFARLFGNQYKASLSSGQLERLRKNDFEKEIFSDADLIIKLENKKFSEGEIQLILNNISKVSAVLGNEEIKDILFKYIKNNWLKDQNSLWENLAEIFAHPEAREKLLKNNIRTAELAGLIKNSEKARGLFFDKNNYLVDKSLIGEEFFEVVKLLDFSDKTIAAEVIKIEGLFKKLEWTQEQVEKLIGSQSEWVVKKAGELLVKNGDKNNSEQKFIDAFYTMAKQKGAGDKEFVIKLKQHLSPSALSAVLEQINFGKDEIVSLLKYSSVTINSLVFAYFPGLAEEIGGSHDYSAKEIFKANPEFAAKYIDYKYIDPLDFIVLLLKDSDAEKKYVTRLLSSDAEKLENYVISHVLPFVGQHTCKEKLENLLEKFIGKAQKADAEIKTRHVESSEEEEKPEEKNQETPASATVSQADFAKASKSAASEIQGLQKNHKFRDIIKKAEDKNNKQEILVAQCLYFNAYMRDDIGERKLEDYKNIKKHNSVFAKFPDSKNAKDVKSALGIYLIDSCWKNHNYLLLTEILADKSEVFKNKKETISYRPEIEKYFLRKLSSGSMSIVAVLKNVLNDSNFIAILAKDFAESFKSVLSEKFKTFSLHSIVEIFADPARVKNIQLFYVDGFPEELKKNMEEKFKSVDGQRFFEIVQTHPVFLQELLPQDTSLFLQKAKELSGIHFFGKVEDRALFEKYCFRSNERDERKETLEKILQADNNAFNNLGINEGLFLWAYKLAPDKIIAILVDTLASRRKEIDEILRNKTWLSILPLNKLNEFITTASQARILFHYFGNVDDKFEDVKNNAEKAEILIRLYDLAKEKYADDPVFKTEKIAQKIAEAQAVISAVTLAKAKEGEDKKVQIQAKTPIVEVAEVSAEVTEVVDAIMASGIPLPPTGGPPLPTGGPLPPTGGLPAPTAKLTKSTPPEKKIAERKVSAPPAAAFDISQVVVRRTEISAAAGSRKIKIDGLEEKDIELLEKLLKEKNNGKLPVNWSQFPNKISGFGRDCTNAEKFTYTLFNFFTEQGLDTNANEIKAIVNKLVAHAKGASGKNIPRTPREKSVSSGSTVKITSALTTAMTTSSTSAPQIPEPEVKMEAANTKDADLKTTSALTTAITASAAMPAPEAKAEEAMQPVAKQPEPAKPANSEQRRNFLAEIHQGRALKRVEKNNDANKKPEEKSVDPGVIIFNSLMNAVAQRRDSVYGTSYNDDEENDRSEWSEDEEDGDTSSSKPGGNSPGNKG